MTKRDTVIRRLRPSTRLIHEEIRKSISFDSSKSCLSASDHDRPASHEIAHFGSRQYMSSREGFPPSPPAREDILYQSSIRPEPHLFTSVASSPPQKRNQPSLLSRSLSTYRPRRPYSSSDTENRKSKEVSRWRTLNIFRHYLKRVDSPSTFSSSSPDSGPCRRHSLQHPNGRPSSLIQPVKRSPCSSSQTHRPTSVKICRSASNSADRIISKETVISEGLAGTSFFIGDTMSGKCGDDERKSHEEVSDARHHRGEARVQQEACQKDEATERLLGEQERQIYMSELRQKYETAKKEKMKAHRSNLEIAKARNEEAITTLESRQLEAEMHLLEQLDRERCSYQIRLRKMEAYCYGSNNVKAYSTHTQPQQVPTISSASSSSHLSSTDNSPSKSSDLTDHDPNDTHPKTPLPCRVITQSHLSALSTTTHHLTHHLDRLQQCRIEVLRGKQENQYAELVVRQEEEIGKMVERQRREMERLERKWGRRVARARLEMGA